MDTGKQFVLTLGRWAARSAADLEALARRAILATAERTLANTPVDTGFLRGNWQPTIGAPTPFKVFEPGDAVEPPKATSLVVATLKAGDTFYFTNNTAYARFVEYGTSKMDGRFYMTRAVQRWQQTVAEQAAAIGFR